MFIRLTAMFYDAANHAMLTSDEVSIGLAASVRVCLSVYLSMKELNYHRSQY